MKTLFPSPTLSAVLFVVWPVLATSLAPGHLVLAALFAIAIPLVLHPVLGLERQAVRPLRAIPLAFVILFDIVRANLAVARLVLGPMGRLRPGFVEVPLDCTHPYSIALLASCITMTPGTVSADVDRDRRRIVVHVLDLDDVQTLVAEVKSRYERPLMEIFGC